MLENAYSISLQIFRRKAFQYFDFFPDVKLIPPHSNTQFGRLFIIKSSEKSLIIIICFGKYVSFRPSALNLDLH